MSDKFMQAGSIIINKDKIRWYQKYNKSPCIEICTKSDGCVFGVTTYKICEGERGYKDLIKFYEKK